MKKLLFILLIPVLGFSQMKWLTAYYAWWQYNSPHPGVVWDGTADGRATTSQLDYKKLTHIVIFSANPKTTAPYLDVLINASDSANLEYGVATGQPAAYLRTVVDSAHANGVKVVLSIGGIYGVGQQNMSTICQDESKVVVFVNACLAYAKRKNLDGIELDWEFPYQADQAGHNRLIRRLRQGLDQWSPKGLLLGAMYARTDETVSGGNLIDGNFFGYDRDSIVAAFDQINLMTYTMWQGNDSQPYYSGFNTPIETPTQFSGYKGYSLTDGATAGKGSIQTWIAAGYPLEKIGVSISGEPSKFTGVTTMAQAYGGYSFASLRDVPSSGRYWDDKAKAPWQVTGTTLYTYEDTTSCRLKVEWADSMGAGGMMLYELGKSYLPSAPTGYKDQILTAIWNAANIGEIEVPAYTITASASAGGSISPSGGVEVDSNETQGFTISASSGYETDSVVVDGSSVGVVSSYSFYNVAANHTIAAYFSTAPSPKLTQASGTYLVDENGDYKILMHDAGWGMFVFISKEDAYDYLDTRKEQGFNAILTALPPPWEAIGESVQKDVGTRNNTYKGENYYQDPPWGATPFTTYNTNYWANADSIINYAESIGMTLIIVPAFIGYDCASDGYGWASEMNARTNANMTSYGNFLAQRYGEKTNIIWSSGGDCNPSTCTNVQSRLRYMVDGVNAYDGVSLWTNHNQRGTTGQDYYSSDNAWLTLNSIYTDSNDVNELALTAIRVGKPYFGIEGRYEVNEAGASVNPQVARKQAYWPMLMGASGWCYGHFTVYVNFPNWKDSLNSLGVARMRYAKGMFESYDWWKLRPDTSHNLVTSGYGTFGNYDYVGAGISSDSTFAIIYLPLRKTITINTNLLNRDSVNWYWFNVNDSSKTFYKSTGRSAGLTGIPSTTGDWVLLLESYEGEDPPEETPRYTINSLASLGGSITPLGDIELDSNSTQQYTITPDSGYLLLYVLVDLQEVDSTTSYTFTGLSANHTIYAYFVADEWYGYQVTTYSLPDVSAGSAYSKQLTGVGGNLDWRILRGRLHEGLWMDWNGLIQGTTEETGSKTFTVMIRERGERTHRARQTYTLTSSTVPATPTLTAPSNGATGVAVDTLVSWSSVSGATKYHVQIDNNSDFGSPIINDSTVTVTYKSMGGLNTSTQHYWRVRAGNTSGWSDYTSSRTFTTAAAEGGPISLVTSAMFTPANITADSCAASITIPSGTNQLALVYLSTNVKVAYDSVKWGSQSFTLVAALDAGGANRREIWRLVNPSAATGSVVAYRDDNAYVGMIVAVFNNINQSNPIGNSNASYGTSTSASVSVSSSSGNVVVDCLGGTFSGSTTFSQGASQTVVREAEDTTVPMGMSYKAGATTTTLTWTLSGSQSWREGAVELINEP